MRRVKLLSAFVIALVLALPATSFAADYPTKPIQIIVPAAPGGDTDLNARLIGQYAGKYLGKPMVIVNVSGAGGSTGSSRVKDAAPDGYAVLFYHGSTLLNQVFGVTKYGIADFDVACIPVMDDTNSFIVREDSRFKGLKDMAAEMKAKDKSVIFAAETGGFVYITSLALTKLVGADFNIVDVGSQAPKNAALMGAQIDITSVPANGVKGFITSKKFRILGMMSEKRHPTYPDAPTCKEQGFDIVIPKPYFYAFPKGTPKAVIDTFNAAIRKAQADPEMQAKFKENDLTAMMVEGTEALTYLQKMQAEFQALADSAKAK
jgi:tripartite-type tricarboxylate transporter receptor subunit TctC